MCFAGNARFIGMCSGCKNYDFEQPFISTQFFYVSRVICKYLLCCNCGGENYRCKIVKKEIEYCWFAKQSKKDYLEKINKSMLICEEYIVFLKEYVMIR